MSKQASKALVGAFMVGGISLLIAAVVVFGGGSFFENRLKFAVFFDSSVMGLSVGAPVMFRGVPVGRVDSIHLNTTLDSFVVTTPVIIDLTYHGLTDLSDGKLSIEKLQEFVDHGLRARLVSQSFVTGQLLVELNFYEKNEPGLKPVENVTVYNEIPVIPSIPSRLDTVVQRLRDLPIEDIGQSVLDITVSLSNILKKAENSKIMDNVGEFTQYVENVSTNVNSIITKLQQTITHYDQLATTATEKVVDTSDTLETFFKNANLLMQKMQEVVQDMQELANPNSTSVTGLNQALREVTEAARALRSLSDTLERTPEVLLRGRGKP